LEIILEALRNSGYDGRFDISWDVAASEFHDFKNKKYNLSRKQEPMTESILKT
jgi:enolase